MSWPPGSRRMRPSSSSTTISRATSDHDDLAGDIGRVPAEPANERVLRERGGAEPVENGGVKGRDFAGRTGFGRRLGNLHGFRPVGRAGRFGQRLEHVARAAHEHRAVADQHVRPRRTGIERVARNRQHFAALVERSARRREAARLRRRLHDDRRPRQPRDDAVSRDEMPLPDLRVHRPFRQEEPALADLLGQHGVFGRIHHVDPARQHRDGACLEGGLVGLGIDTPCEPRDDDFPGLAEFARKAACHPEAERGGGARAHEPAGGAAKKPDVADCPEDGGRVGNFGEKGGVVRRAPREGNRAGAPARFEFGGGDAGRAGGVVLDARLGRDARQCLEGLARIAMLFHQSVEGRHADPA